MMRVRSSAAIFVIALTFVGALTARAASPGTNPFTEVVVRWILDNGTIESVQSRGALPGNYVPTGILYQFCLPPGDSETNTTASGTFTVAPDGKLTGICQASRTQDSGDGSSISVTKSGTLSGTYDLAAQTVRFRFEGTNETILTQPSSCQVNCAPMVSNATVVVEGPVTGGEVIGDRVDGTVRHTYTCAPAANCAITRQVSTGKFFFDFLPPLPSADPGTGGGTTDGGNDGGFFSGDGTPLVIILLLILLLATVMAFLRRGMPKGITASTPSSVETVDGLVGLMAEDGVAGHGPGITAGQAAIDAAKSTLPPPEPDREAEAQFVAEWNRAAEAAKAQRSSDPTADVTAVDGLVGLIAEGAATKPNGGPGGGDAAPLPTASKPPIPSGAPLAGAPTAPAAPVEGDIDPEKPMAEAVGDVPGLGADIKAAWERHPIGPDSSSGAISGAVGSDRSGGHEGQLGYGESAGTASPAADKAYEALVVAQSQQANADEPRTNADDAKERQEDRERERHTGSDMEGR